MSKTSNVPDDPSGTSASPGARGEQHPLAGDGTPIDTAGIPADQAAVDAGVAEAVVALSDADLPTSERRKAIGKIAAGLRHRGFKDVFKPKAAMEWISETVVDIAPRIPLRDLPTLYAQHPGMNANQIADRLVRNAGRSTAAVGAVGGGVSALEWALPPTLLSAPVLLAAETVAVVAIEIKLIGELQELYGQPVPGHGASRAISLLQAWAGKRGVNLMVPGRGMAAVLSTAARHELRDRLLRRFGRNLTTLGPVFTGAAVAAYLNRRATRSLAELVQKDLARRIPRQITPS